MKRERWIADFAAALITALLATCGVGRAAGQGGDAAASVMAIRGKVQAVNRENVARALALKDPVFLGDTVKTAARGRLQLHFGDGTIISLGRNTEMTIEDYEYKPEESRGALVTRVHTGVFRVMGGAITKLAPERFKTTTPTATIGIRGSYYMGLQFQLDLDVVFLGGVGIDVGDGENGLGIETPNYGVQLRQGMDWPEHASLFDADMLRNMLNEFGFGRLGGHLRRPGFRPLQRRRSRRNIEREMRDRLRQQVQNRLLPEFLKGPNPPQPPPRPGTEWHGFATNAEGGDEVLDIADAAAFVKDNPPEPAMTSLVYWGYWNDTDMDRGGFWAAGKRTDRNYVRGLINTTGFTATYRGGARCLATPVEGTQRELSGSSLFNILFDTSTVNGTLSFPADATNPAVLMQAQGVLDAGGNGFNQGSGTGITSVEVGREAIAPAVGSLQGHFYGPNADQIGGTFSAQVPDTTYVGTFSAEK